MRKVLWIGCGVVIGIGVCIAGLGLRPVPARAQSATGQLPAPACATSSSTGVSSFACAADVNGGGRQEVIIGTSIYGSGAGKGIIISTGGIQPFTF